MFGYAPPFSSTFQNDNEVVEKAECVSYLSHLSFNPCQVTLPDMINLILKNTFIKTILNVTCVPLCQQSVSRWWVDCLHMSIDIKFD